MTFLEDLAARRRFGMKPGLETIRALCAALGDPQLKFKSIHVAGTNGKGAVCAILDAALRTAPAKEEVKSKSEKVRRLRIGRYTSPHLVKLNERFFLDGAPVDDPTLERVADRVETVIRGDRGHCAVDSCSTLRDTTFFEALTAVAFLLYAEAKVDYAILECGLGGRLDATNVCDPALCVITRIGLDHCDWLGDTVEKIAVETAGIDKPGVPVVLGRNEPSVRAVIEARAKEVGAPFHYAPDLADESEIPAGFSLPGSFNRENAITAIASLKVFAAKGAQRGAKKFLTGFGNVIWPGRFQRVGNFIVDGAHNPPAARALRESLEGLGGLEGLDESIPSKIPKQLNLIFGACGDKDVGEVLSILAPVVKKGYAVKTNNPRSLSAEETAAKMRAVGIDAVACESLKGAIRLSALSTQHQARSTLICGSLFLAGEALVELGAYPWGGTRFDVNEAHSTTGVLA